MSKAKDNSTLYAIIVTMVILFFIVGFKYINAINFDLPETQPGMNETPLENYTTAPREVGTAEVGNKSSTFLTIMVNMN